jgi:hypothetical protein
MSFLDRMNKAMENPMFHMGLGILAADPERGALGALGQGGLLGMRSHRQHIQGQLGADAHQLAVEEGKMKLDEHRRKREMMEMLRSPQFQQEAAGLLGPGASPMMGFLAKYSPAAVPGFMAQFALQQAKPQQLPSDIRTAQYLTKMAAENPEAANQLMGVMTRLKQAGATRISTTNRITGEKRSPFQKFAGNMLDNIATNLAETEGSAMTSDAAIDTLMTMMEQENATGQWAPAAMRVKQILGLSPDEVATMEVFNSQVGEGTMAKLKNFPGAISEGERKFVQERSADPQRTPFTNFVLLRIMGDAERRAKDIYNSVLDFMKENPEATDYDIAKFKSTYSVPENLRYSPQRLMDEFNSMVPGKYKVKLPPSKFLDFSKVK